MIRILSKAVRSSILGLVALVVICCGTPQAVTQEQEAKSSKFSIGNKPELIAPGIVSTKMGEYSPTFDVKRKELYFMRRTPELFDYTIYYSKFDGAGWSSPEVAPFSGKFRDAAPYLNPAGDEIFFDSARPVEGLAKNSINLWRAVRVGGSWGEAKLLRVPSENLPQKDRAGEDELATCS